MPAAATQETRMATRTGTGTARKPSRKARDAAEAELDLPDELPAQPRKKSKKHRTQADANIENRDPGESGEFQFTTLPANRTSRRAPNVIKLSAKPDGIPRNAGKVVVAAPAQVVAAQRKAASTPAPPKRKLTPETAAQLARLRNPFVSPSQVAAVSGNSQHRRALAHKVSAPQASMLQASQASPSQAATPRRSTGNPQASQAASADGWSHMPPPPHPRRSVAPMPRQSSVQPSHARRSPSPTDSIIPEVKARYAVSSITYADTVGKIPRMDKGFHVAALEDVDAEWTDEGEPYEDYASHPRAHATALAFGSQLNAAIPQVHDFNAEEMEEMDDDPEADLLSGAEDEDRDGVHDANEAMDVQQPFDHDEEPEPSAEETARAVRYTQRFKEAEDFHPLSRDDDSEELPEAQHRDVPAGKKVGVRDYEAPAQEVLLRAITIYKTHITAENAYPDKLQEKTWAKAAWTSATHELDIKMKADTRAIELIARNSWGLRGEIKGYARHFVPGEYGFKQVLSTDAEGVQRNVDLARQLLETNTFKYKDPSTRSDLFEGDIVQTIINKVFYKNPADDGVIHDDVYRPFPMRGVALVLTAIQNAIQEWATGIHQNVNFGEDMYEDQYKIHLEDLKGYEKRSQELKIVSHICQKLSTYGRDHAKAPLTPQAGGTGGLPADDLDRAVAAYRLKLQDL